MKDSPLPVTREEFEDRALLYSVLMDLEYFLQLKKDFADALTKEQVRKYCVIRQNLSVAVVDISPQASVSYASGRFQFKLFRVSGPG